MRIQQKSCPSTLAAANMRTRSNAVLLSLFAFLSWTLVAASERPVHRLLMGMRSSNLTATVVYNPLPLDGFDPSIVSLHIIIPTIGRTSIFKLLDSLEPQLQQQDHVTVVYDAKDVDNVWNDVEAALARLPGKNRAIMEAENANDFGAAIKSRHMTKGLGNFVMFADDDNWYEPDALQNVRSVVQHDHDGLYFFQMRDASGSSRRVPNLPHNGEVETGNVDTGCGVVPIRHVHLSDWTKGSYTADGDFYTALSDRMPRTYLIQKVIYVYNDHCACDDSGDVQCKHC